MEEQSIEQMIPQVKMGDCHILFLDVSSTCTGWTIASVDFMNRKATIDKAGCIWFNARWENPEKYDYLYNAIQNYFEVVETIDHIVLEQYSVNTKKGTGCLVSPEIHGVLKAAAFSNGIKTSYITPQQWRKILGIKPNITVVGETKKREYKEPTKQKILETIKVPDQIVSNITQKLRSTPSDIYDSLAISLASLSKWKIKNITADNCKFNNTVGELK